MQSSWVQHNTVVANQTREFLQRLFIEGGEQKELFGNEPLLLADQTKLYFVEKGAVDIFMVEIVDGKPRGRRTHYLRIEEGQIMMGLELLPTLVQGVSFGVIACGLPDTQIRIIDKETARKHAQILRVIDGLHALVEIWVGSLAKNLNSGPMPRYLDEIEPGPNWDIPSGIWLTPMSGVLWVHHIEGTISISGVTELQPWKQTSYIPLARGSWIETITDSLLTVIDSEKLFQLDPTWVSLRRFHRICLNSMARAREEEAAQNLLDESTRRAKEEKAIDLSIRELALFGNEPAAALNRPSETTDPVVRACQWIGEYDGFKVQAPSARPDGDDSPTTILEVANASHVRCREVLLRVGWWKQSGPPLIGSTGAEGSCVALLPYSNGKGYEIRDPLTNQSFQVTEQIAENIEPKAHEIYRPFPRKKLTPIDIVRFSLKGSYRDLLTVVLSGLLIGIFGMIVPYVTGLVVDDLIPNAKHNVIIQMGIALIVVAFSSALITIAQTFATIRVELRGSTALQSAVWDRLLGLSLPFFRKYGSGDLAARAAGIDLIRRSLSGSTINLLLSSGFSLLNFFLMLYYDAKLAGIGFLIAMGSVALAVIVSFATVYMRRSLADIDGKLASLMLQLLTGIQKIRISGAESRAFAVWSKTFSEKRNLEFRVENLENTFAVISSAYPTLCTAFVYYMVVESVRSGALGAGDFLAFNAAFGIFLGGLLSIVGKAVELFELLPIYERAKPILETIPEVNDEAEHPGELSGALQVNHVSFRYDVDGAPIIDDVDFSIERGEYVALVGTTAAGKSTLFRLMLGFERPESGGVYYDGRNLDSLDVAEVRRQLGVVLQNGDLMAGDIFSNIVGNRPLTHEDAWEAAEKAGLADEIRAMPMQMHTVVGQGGGTLSGGQRQRLQIARAIVNRPRIIFFDEATSALDNRTQTIVSESLDRLHATRIVIAHRLSTIKNADRIIVLERGRIIQQGTFEELMEVEGAFREQAQRQIA